MRVLVCGMDGYIGWPLTLHLLSLGHEVYGFDNFSRRKNVEEIGSWSALPILQINQRIENLKKKYNDKINFYQGDAQDPKFTDDVLKKTSPQCIVHLAEQPSAPYSMIDQEHAIFTQKNNVMGTLNLLYSIKQHCPNAHLIKLGTMGEYGTPNLDIAEGFFEVEFRGKKEVIPFPKLAGSWYHWSKVHDSNNIMFACKLWNLCSTDIMQGVVYGTHTNEIDDETKYTRFDFDEVFGTVINRFCAQAVTGHPLTIYGKGGQTRGFLALEDSIQCIRILIENPAEQGQYRVVNQFDEQYNVSDLAKIVEKVATKNGLKVSINHVENPRIEKERHYYKADHDKLKKLGFKQTKSIEDQVDIILNDLIKHKDRIEQKRKVIVKNILWDGGIPENTSSTV